MIPRSLVLASIIGIPVLLTSCGSVSDDTAAIPAKDQNGFPVTFAGNAGDIQDRPFYVDGTVVLTGFDRAVKADGTQHTITSGATTVTIPTSQNTGTSPTTAQQALWLQNTRITLTGSTTSARLGIPYYQLAITVDNLVDDTKDTRVQVGLARDINGDVYAFRNDAAAPDPLVVRKVTATTIDVPVWQTNTANGVQAIVTDFTLNIPTASAPVASGGIAPYSGTAGTVTGGTGATGVTSSVLIQYVTAPAATTITGLINYTATTTTRTSFALGSATAVAAPTTTTNGFYTPNSLIFGTTPTPVVQYWRPGAGLVEAVTVAPAYNAQFTGTTATASVANFTVNDRDTGINSAGFATVRRISN